jgi:hypothetical protein
MTEERAITRAQVAVPIVEGKGLMPSDMEGLWRISGIIAASGMAPKDMHGKPEAVFVACQMGFEVGMSIMASIQNIAVINGRPSIWGDSVLALVRASNRLKKFSEVFTGEFPKDDFKAICTVLREGDQEPTVREFSIADAKTANLWVYPHQGVTPWHKYPKRMLQMRARSWALRDTFGDILKGMKITEEVMDYDVDMVPDKKGTYKASAMPNYSMPGDNAELAAQFDEALAEIPDGVKILEWFIKVAEASKMPLEAAKAEVIRTNDLDNCIANYRAQLPKEVNNVQSPDSGSNGPGDSGNEPWNPETSELQQRYPEDKRQAIKECAERLGIDPRGKVASAIHAEILEAAKAKPDEKQLMLLEKYNELWVSASKMAKNWAQVTMQPNLADGERPPEDRIGEWVQLVEEYAANEKM